MKYMHFANKQKYCLIFFHNLRILLYKYCDRTWLILNTIQSRETWRQNNERPNEKKLPKKKERIKKKHNNRKWLSTVQHTAEQDRRMARVMPRLFYTYLNEYIELWWYTAPHRNVHTLCDVVVIEKNPCGMYRPIPVLIWMMWWWISYLESLFGMDCVCPPDRHTPTLNLIHCTTYDSNGIASHWSLPIIVVWLSLRLLYFLFAQTDRPFRYKCQVNILFSYVIEW